jgi:hypothetical protein
MEEKKNEVDNGAGKPFRSQRDNKEKPASACNVTSMIIALCAAGWPVDKFSSCDEQPEDLLMRFIYSDQPSLNKWRQLDPQGNIPPNQWHAVLAFASNRFVRKYGFNSTPVVFNTSVSVDEIVAAIDGGGAAVISGLFPQAGRAPLRHVVAAVGYGRNEGGFYFIIDDPWGNYHTGYKNHDGKAIRMPIADFNRMMNAQGQPRKWAHIVKKFEKRGS